MEEDKPFGGPDQDFVFGEFAKAEYEVCRKQVVGIVPGISFDDFPGRDVQKVDSGVECPYPHNRLPSASRPWILVAESGWTGLVREKFVILPVVGL